MMQIRWWLTAVAMAVAMFGSSPGHAQRSTPASTSRLLVLNKEDATFAVIDPTAGQVLGTVPVGQGPHELVASPDGKWAFASNYGTGQAPGHTISMIDIAALKEVRRIDVAPLNRPHGLAFANGKLYFTAEASKAIARYDPAADIIDWTFETGQDGTHMMLVTRDAKTIFTSNIASNSVSKIEQGPGGAWTQTIIPVGKGPEGIELSPDGRTVWSAHSRDGGVSIIDVAARSDNTAFGSLQVMATVDAGTKRSNRMKLTPDGKFALISDLDAGDLVVLDVVARKPIRRIPLGRMPEGILVPAGGSRAFVAVNGDNQVAVIELGTWQVTRRIQTGKGPDGMAWRP
jgi:YVTN family beta-propeller protein